MDGCICRLFPTISLLVTKVHVNKIRPESHRKTPPLGVAQSSKEHFAGPTGHSAVLGSGNTLPGEELCL